MMEGQFHYGDTLDDDSFWGRFVIEPTSAARVGWDTFCLFVIAWTVFYFPLLVFESLDDAAVSQVVDIITAVFWTTDTSLQFLTGIHVDGMVEMRPRVIAFHHLRSWSFLYDLIL